LYPRQAQIPLRWAENYGSRRTTVPISKDDELLQGHLGTALQDAGFLLDKDAFVVGANPAAQRFSRGGKDVVGTAFPDFFEDRDSVQMAWAEARRKLPIPAKLPCRIAEAVAIIGNFESLDSRAEEQGMTEREKEIVVLLMQGRNKTEIADKVFISPATVKRYIYNIYQKTGAKSRVDLFGRFFQGKKSPSSAATFVSLRFEFLGRRRLTAEGAEERRGGKGKGGDFGFQSFLRTEAWYPDSFPSVSSDFFKFKAVHPSGHGCFPPVSSGFHRLFIPY